MTTQPIPNRAHWRALLPIIQAYVDGAAIELRVVDDVEPEIWQNISDEADTALGITFSNTPDAYRLGPKPPLLPLGTRIISASHGPGTIVAHTAYGEYVAYMDLFRGTMCFGADELKPMTP